MKKYRIQIVKLGHQRHNYVFKKIAKYKSDIFDITISDKVDLPDTDSDWAYSTNLIGEILLDRFDSEKYDICIGFLDHRLDGNVYRNCYGSNIKDHKVFVASFFQMADYLAEENINLLNYVLVIIYRYLTRFIMKDSIKHDETRGCINDMCGTKAEIVHSCKEPRLCQSCEEKMGNKEFPVNYIDLLKKELKKIKKPIYHRIAVFIRRHPILSILTAAFSTIGLGLLTNMIFYFLIN